MKVWPVFRQGSLQEYKEMDNVAGAALEADRKKHSKMANTADRLGKKHAGAFYFWTGFLVSAVLAGIGFFIIGVWPAGDGTVLIIDSLHQYLPFYTEFHEKLTSGTGLLYSFSAGFGYNFWATYAYYLASPLNFLIVLVPTANVCDFMDLMILLKIGLCGGTFSWYMYQKGTRTPALPAAFGAMFALSNFIIGYYFNLMWLDSVAMTPLICCGIERICGIGRDHRRSDISDARLYALSLCYGIWCNYYIGFMLCIFSVLWFIVCMITAGRCRLSLFFTRVMRFGVSSVLAGGVGSVVLLPAYMALTRSESMESNHFPAVIEFYDSLQDLLLTHFAGIKPINIANTQVGLNAYCGVAVLMLTVLFALNGFFSVRERISRLALASFLLLSFSLKPLNYIWHGFHQQNGLPNRFAFIYVAVILMMSYDGLRDLRKMPVWKIAAAGAVPAAFAVVSFLRGTGLDYEGNPYDESVYILTIALLVLYTAVILVIRLTGMGVKAGSVILASILTAEAGAGGISGIISNDSVTRSIYLDDQKSYKALMAQIGDDSWYRSEVDSQRMRNVTLFCGGNSVVMFNSTMQASVTQFCDAIGMEARTNKNGYNGVTKLMNDVFGIKYVLSSNGNGVSLYSFPAVTDDGNLTVYENADALPLGFLVNSEITQWDLSGETPIDVQDDFVRLATGHEGIYTLDRYLALENGVSNGIRIPEGKQVYVYLPSRAKEIKLTTPEYSKTYTTFTDHLYVIDSSDGSFDATLTASLTDGEELDAIIYTCPDSAEEEVRDILARNPLENVSAKGSTLTGTIHADKDGELLLTIPYDSSWTCRVDGQIVEADCIGEALMGLKLSEGDHQIQLDYMPAGLKAGAMLSAISAALMALFLILGTRRRRRELALEEGSVNGRFIDEILDEAGEDAVLEKELMRKHTSFRVGGPADLFVTPKNEKDLAGVISICRQRQVPYMVIGNGTNILVSDEGYRGVIIRIGRNFSDISVSGTEITAQAGASLSAVAGKALEASLTGMEEVSGIPGTIGGAITMNAGAYGSEMKDITRQVTVLKQDGTIVTLSGDLMEFGYRTSRIQKENMIVLSAVLSLKGGDREEIRGRMDELRRRRQEKQPLDMPSGGSTFKRPEGYYAAALIDEAGLRGERCGGAQVSEKHCGFIVNTGGASAGDVRRLIAIVRDTVYRNSGVWLETEVKMVGFGEDN